MVQRIFGVSSAEDSSESTSSALINLPAGRLYLIRPKHTTKVEKECIYLEAELAVRRTADPFHYELVVERVTEEVREEEEEDVSSIEDDSQKAFLLDESLDFRVYDAIDESEDEETPTVAFSWLDHSSPDISERFEFLINIRHEGCSRTEIGHLESVVYQCIVRYLSKYPLDVDFRYPSPAFQMKPLNDATCDCLTHVFSGNGRIRKAARMPQMMS